MAIFSQKRIYLDNAASSPLDPRVERVVAEVSRSFIGNPSALHAEGVAARRELERNRVRFAELLGVHSDEIVWTSGGTEGNALALMGVARAPEALSHGKHLVVSAFEHPSVLETARALELEGWEVTLVFPDERGFMSAKAVAKEIRPHTVLVSVMLAQNEIGTLQSLAEIAREVRRVRKGGARFPLLHTDACQALGQIPVDLARLGVDVATMSAHKMHGPKGVGALYLKRGTPFTPVVYGGGQENGVRSGTENLPAIAGMTRALEVAIEEMNAESLRKITLRDHAWERIQKEIDGVVLNGSLESRLPGNLNISFADLESQELVIRLDAKGVAVSSGSACSTKELESKYVILALRKNEKEAAGALRITLGRFSTKNEVDRCVDELVAIVDSMRKSVLQGLISDRVTKA